MKHALPFIVTWMNIGVYCAQQSKQAHREMYMILCMGSNNPQSIIKEKEQCSFVYVALEGCRRGKHWLKATLSVDFRVFMLFLFFSSISMVRYHGQNQLSGDERIIWSMFLA